MKTRLYQRYRRWRDDRGMTLVLVAVMLGVLFGMGALVVDVGTLYWTRRGLQNATDGAALAGAWELPQNKAAAQAKAYEYAANNGVPAGEIESITFGCKWQTGAMCPDTITVSAKRSMPPIFRAVIGLGKTNVAAQATAIAAAVQPRQLVPWGVTAGTEQAGEVDLKTGAQASDKGNFRAVDFPDSSSKDYSKYIANGYDGTVPDPVSPSNPWPIKTEPGDKTGLTISAVSQLIAAEPGNDCRDPNGNPYAVDGSGNPDTNNIVCPRVVTVPLIAESWDETFGKSTVNIVGFAAFRIDGVACTDGGVLDPSTGTCKPKGKAIVKGHFIDYVTGTGTAKYGVPLDYSGIKGVFFWK